MADIQLKYNLLDAASKKEVNDFVDFLLNKKKKKTESISSYKKKILKVSSWTDEDIAKIEEAQKHMNNWTPLQW
jgi:site-specific recombinase XerD